MCSNLIQRLVCVVYEIEEQIERTKISSTERERASAGRSILWLSIEFENVKMRACVLKHQLEV